MEVPESLNYLISMVLQPQYVIWFESVSICLKATKTDTDPDYLRTDHIRHGHRSEFIVDGLQWSS